MVSERARTSTIFVAVTAVSMSVLPGAAWAQEGEPGPAAATEDATWPNAGDGLSTHGIGSGRLTIEPAPRSIEERYVDALAGSWAATGLMVLGIGATATGLGLAAGCMVVSWNCGAGGVYTSAIGGALGWLLGPGLGAGRGLGLDPGEAFFPWALGVLTFGAAVGLGAAVGFVLKTALGSFRGSGVAAGGLLVGLGVGALAHVFLTPLYGVLMYDDRLEDEPTDIRPIVNAWVVPTETGVAAGLGGAF